MHECTGNDGPLHHSRRASAFGDAREEKKGEENGHLRAEQNGFDIFFAIRAAERHPKPEARRSDF